jgi:hypothetical protein
MNTTIKRMLNTRELLIIHALGWIKYVMSITQNAPMKNTSDLLYKRKRGLKKRVASSDKPCLFIIISTVLSKERTTNNGRPINPSIPMSTTISLFIMLPLPGRTS